MMPAADVMKLILEKSRDPEVDRLARIVLSRIPQRLKEAVGANKRSRTLVISVLLEVYPNMPPSTTQNNLEVKVSEVSAVVNVE